MKSLILILDVDRLEESEGLEPMITKSPEFNKFMDLEGDRGAVEFNASYFD